MMARNSQTNPESKHSGGQPAMFNWPLMANFPAFALLAIFCVIFAAPVQAKVGTNTFATPYVIPPGGTLGAISVPPTTGTTAATTYLTTIGGSLEYVAGTSVLNEPLIQVRNGQTGATMPVQGQTVWFSWTPVQSTTTFITITSNNGSAYQFQPVAAIYSFAAGTTPVLSARLTPDASYAVSPNPVDGTKAPRVASPNAVNLAVPGIFQTVIALNAVAGTTYMIQVDGALTSEFPYLGQGNFTFSLQPNQVPALAPAVAFQPQSGWWYSPNSPGVGFAIEFRNSVALVNPGAFYLGMLVYDYAGNSRWYSSTGQLAYTSTGLPGQLPTAFTPYVPVVAANAYYTVPTSSQIIPLNQYAGGPALSGAVTPVSLVGSGGALTMQFTSSTQGFMAVNGNQFAIYRYPFTNATPTLPSTSISATSTTIPPQTGWYVNTSEVGRYYFVEQQANALFAGLMMFRPSTTISGTDAWYISTNTLSGANLYSGRLYEYGGGDVIGNLAWIYHAVVNSSVDRGPFAMSFVTSATASTTATATYSGRTTSLTRLTF